MAKWRPRRWRQRAAASLTTLPEGDAVWRRRTTIDPPLRRRRRPALRTIISARSYVQTGPPAAAANARPPAQDIVQQHTVGVHAARPSAYLDPGFKAKRSTIMLQNEFSTSHTASTTERSFLVLYRSIILWIL